VDEALAPQIVHRALPAVVVRPVVLPHVELEQIDVRTVQVRQTLLRVFADVVGREHLVERRAAA
jgi:hypothetical protein